MENQTTLDRILAVKATEWLTHTDEEGNLDIKATYDYILSNVQTCLEEVCPVKGIGALMEAVVFFAINHKNTESVKEATEALARVIRINDSLNFFNDALSIFCTGFDEYLVAMRIEKGNEIYPQ